MDNKIPKVVIIGHVSYDEVINHCGQRSIVPGGAAYFAAISASLYSKEIGIVSRVGEDYAEIGRLSSLGINLEGVHQVKEGKTTRFHHVYKTPDHSQREFRGELNVGATLLPEDIPPHYLEAYHIHIATMPPQQQRLFADFIGKNSKAKISVDTIAQYIEKWPRDVGDSFQNADLLFMNKREYGLLKMAGILVQLVGKAIVLKKGVGGVEFIRGEKIISVPAPKTAQVIDKTGSGDVLAGVFLALLTKGETFEKALHEAVRIASRSIEGFGVDFLLDKQSFLK